MMRVELRENRIFLGFTATGEVVTARGVFDINDYNLATAFIVPYDTPLYRIADYLGYRAIHESWKEVKL